MPKRAAPKSRLIFPPPGTLKPHPKNYRDHPAEQVDHLVESLQESGFYQNIVAAKDLTILAGHGIVKAALRLKLKRVPVRQLYIGPNSAQAMKLLVADNELSRMAERDDRLLVELLHDVEARDLLGSGHDEKTLRLLSMIVRDKGEIQGFDPFAEWTGMPDYNPGREPVVVNLLFPTEEARKRFVEKHKLETESRGSALGCWWPAREDEDISAVRWEE